MSNNMKLLSKSAGGLVRASRGLVRTDDGGLVRVGGGWSCVWCRRLPSSALDMQTLNPNVIKLQYAVRGPLVIRATQLENELKKGAQKPFKKIIRANLGDAQAMGQKPITFIRQVVACVCFPEIIETGCFPDDVKERAREILKACSGGSVGAYTFSRGLELVRRNVAAYLECRDCTPANADDISLSNGASTSIKNLLKLFICDVGGKPTGVMIPIPQYPLYSATLDEYGLEKVSYYLDEDKGWALDTCELERSYKEAEGRCKIRALVVINPGNPTGQVLTRQNVEDVIKFAHCHNLYVLADEVYQHNVYDPKSKFYSFKRVLREMGNPYSKDLGLASFMTASKGYMGECGLRGGWMETINMDKEVYAQYNKVVSAMLCPTTVGQTIMDCVARPPKCGDPSYELWKKETTDILSSLKERSISVVQSFNQMKGFKCNPVQGAMYAFPRIELPPKAIEEAKKDKKTPDGFYAFRLLEETGICIVPGSGFGQRPGTYHFRTTILPQPPLLKEMLETFKKFHEKFTKEFS